MIKLKNFMLFNEFGTAVSLLADRKDVPPAAKLALVGIYRKFQERLADIETVRPLPDKDGKLTDKQISLFGCLMKTDFVFESDKICIKDVVELLSTKDLMLLDPILMEDM